MSEETSGDDLVPTVQDSADSDVEEQIGELIGRLSGDEELDRETRGRLLARLVRLLAASARKAGAKGLAGGRWMADLFADIVPHIKVRDLETLRRHHTGPAGEPLSGERLADSLVRSAANATTAVGAAGGALASVEFVAPPLLLTTPFQVAAEAMLVAAIEVRMVAELYEVYGVQIPGSRTARASAYATGWARQRGINPLEPGSATYAMGAATKAALRRRLLRTAGRNFTTLGPFLTGAVAGGALNRVATKRLADNIRQDLRRMIGQSVPPPSLPPEED